VLPPPQLAGRTGQYDDGHRLRLDTILRLQRRGYSLAAIGDLVAAWEGGGTLGDVLGLEARSPSRSSRRSRREGDADVIFLDDLREWRVPRGSGLALLPGPVLRSWEEPSRN
jgi:DNA-binding transcriptional MerR regulator